MKKMKGMFIRVVLRWAGVALLVMQVVASFGQVVYITPGGAGLMDGTTWANALNGNGADTGGYTRLSVRLSQALPGSRFWISAGSYLPCTDGDRSKSFLIGQDVRIYGGFAGTESDTLQRTILTNPTVFSGDIGVAGDSTDNSKTVIRTKPDNWVLYSFLDGLTITGGFNPDWNTPASGLVNGGNLVVKGCEFRSNHGTGDGGGIQNHSLIRVENCLFYRNSAFWGGGIYNSWTGTAEVIASRFCNNSCYLMGGGVHDAGVMTLTNCLVANNSSCGGGGVTGFGNVNMYGIKLSLINSTIVNNEFSGGTVNMVFYYGTLKVYNSILWGGELLLANNPVTDFRHSIIQGYAADSLVFTWSPSFINPTNGIGIGYDGLNADWRLSGCSPAINAGADSLLPPGTVVDLAGQQRIRYTAVDLGALEADTTGQSMTIGFDHPRIYVNDSIYYQGDGGTWTTALAGNAPSCRYPERSLLYEAMKDAAPGTEIWLRDGVYQSSRSGDRSHAFTVGAGVKVLGGFQGNETAAVQRDPGMHPVIFSGNTGNPSLSSDNSYHVLDMLPDSIPSTDTALIDGITVCDGFGSVEEDGGGIRIRSHVKVCFRRVVVSANKTEGVAAGIRIDSLAHASFMACGIAGNQGYGIYNRGHLVLDSTDVKNNCSNSVSGIFNGDTVIMNNCRIDSNSAVYPGYPSRGGGLENMGYCQIHSGVFRGNRTYVKGGAIWNGPAGHLEINQSLLSGNRADTYPGGLGGAVFNEGVMQLMDTELLGNAAGYDGAAIFNDGGATCTTERCSIAGNTVAGAPWPTTQAAVMNLGTAAFKTTMVAGNNGTGLHHPTRVTHCIVVNNRDGILADGQCTGILGATVAHNLHEGISTVSVLPVPLKNCIVYENGNDLSGPFTGTHTCTALILPGTGNIIEKPCWTDPSPGLGPGFNMTGADWTPAPWSPCVNTGDNAQDDPSDTLDIYGHPRLKFGTVDMGAVELQQPPQGWPPEINSAVRQVFRPRPTDIRLTTAVPWQSLMLDSLVTAPEADLTAQTRLRGYLVPPADGYYRFWFASDIGGAFYLGTDSTEQSMRLICRNPDGNSVWPDSLGAVDSLWLQAGNPLYFESFCKQQNYGWLNPPQHYMKIGWTLPGSNRLAVITAEYLRRAKPKLDLSVDWELYKNWTVCDFTALKNTNTAPDEIVKLDSLQTVDHSTKLDFFASRMRGYLFAPVTGTYQFYFACDNTGQFWLSPDTTSGAAILKNEILAAQSDWNLSVSSVDLVAGHSYFFEILHYDTAYTDQVKLGWTIPGSTGPEVIRSPYLTSCHEPKAGFSLHLPDGPLLLRIGCTKTPGVCLLPWNTDYKGIRWSVSSDTVADVDRYGRITALAPGICRVVASLAEYPSVRDSVAVIVSDYNGPFYVTENAEVAGSGHSWDDPARLTTLLDYLNQGPLPERVTVFATEGFYRPTETIDRNKSFVISNIRLIGGYSAESDGTDTTLRSPEVHQTVLSGEIGDPGTTIDNAYHVVSMNGNAILDGLTIRDGRASCSTYGSTPGFYIFKPDDNGGGIFVSGPGNVVRNCRILNNSAWNRGGGICGYYGTIHLDNVLVEENLIQQVAMINWGVFVIYINGNGAGLAMGLSTLSATNAVFRHNTTAVGSGTSAYIGLSSSGTFNGCSFYSNSGVGPDLYAKDGAMITLQNSTLRGTVGLCGSGGNIIGSTILGSVVNGCNPYNNGAITIDNSYISTIDGAVLNDGASMVRYSIAGSNLYGKDKFTLLSDTVPAVATWLDTLAFNGGLTPTMRLKNVPGNPARTNGNPLYLGATDQRGFLRNDTVSIGAYQWTWPSQILIDPQQASMAPGDTLPYTVTVLPAWADDKTWSASSSDASVIGMAETALVAVEEGNARVTVRTHDASHSDTCLVTVLPDSVAALGTVHNGNTACYSALGTVAVAGNGTPFLVKNGGSAHLIAGERILLLTGTKVEPGGSMLGEISPQGPWCQAFKEAPVASAVEGEDANVADPEFGIRVWPNPTDGRFHIKTTREGSTEPTLVRCFDQTGLLLFSVQWQPGTSQTLSLEGRVPGLYLLQLMQGGRSDVVKILKL